jgi:hypothetical protein
MGVQRFSSALSLDRFTIGATRFRSRRRSSFEWKP